MGSIKTAPQTNDIYKALTNGNTGRLRSLLENYGLSRSEDSGFSTIKRCYFEDLKNAIIAVSKLNESTSSVNPRETDLILFFDYIANAIDPTSFLHQVNAIVPTENGRRTKLPKDIQKALEESESENRIAEQIEEFDYDHLKRLIIYVSSSKKEGHVSINYRRLRAIIRAIRKTKLITHEQLCNIMPRTLRK